MTQFAIAVVPFHEEGQRAFEEAVARMVFGDYDIASGNALILARRFRQVVDALTTALGADGIAIDVHPVEALPYDTQRDCAITDSFELVPGRPLTTWYCEECHDGGRPHAASTPAP